MSDSACPNCGAFPFFGQAAPEECPFCAEDMPEMTCPRCKVEMPDYDGFGVLYHPACGYCVHANRADGVCEFCGDKEKPDGR